MEKFYTEETNVTPSNFNSYTDSQSPSQERPGFSPPAMDLSLSPSSRHASSLSPSPSSPSSLSPSSPLESPHSSSSPQPHLFSRVSPGVSAQRNDADSCCFSTYQGRIIVALSPNVSATFSPRNDSLHHPQSICVTLYCCVMKK